MVSRNWIDLVTYFPTNICLFVLLKLDLNKSIISVDASMVMEAILENQHTNDTSGID